MPYLNVVDAEGERQVALTLMTDDQVSEAFARDKEEIGSEISRMQAEIQALIEEARTEAREEAIEALEEAQESLEEA
jgi:vacuolar-type H+-ATPase subunit H